MTSRSAYHRSLLNRNNHESKPPFLKSFVISVAAVCTALVLLVLFFSWLVKYRKSKINLQVQTRPPDLGHGSLRKLRKFTYKELKEATHKFAETQKVGKGGYGVVYRGLLRSGDEVAVKKLVLSSMHGEREFQNELAICSRLESRYVVKLLGFASHGKKVRLLVYEFMQNRSLQEALLEKHTSVHLNWEKRFSIILDTARALGYMHLECCPAIVHGDVKPSNVLLDGDFRACLADFGLARTQTADQSLDHSPQSFKADLAEMDIGTSESGETPKFKSVDVLLERQRKHGKVYDAKALASFGEQSLPTSYLGSPHSAVRFSSDLRLDIDIHGSTSAPTKILRVDPNLPDHNVLQNVLLVADHGHTSVQNGDLNSHPVEDGSLDQTVASLPACLAARRASSKDSWFWRKQENSREVKVRDYVMEWMKSEFSNDQNQRRVTPSQQNEEHQDVTTLEGTNETAMKKEGRQQEPRTRRANAMEEGQSKIGQAKRKDKTKSRAMERKGREWWKDEYFAELSRKGAHSNCPNKAMSGRGNVHSVRASMDRLRLSNVTSSNSRRLRGDSMGESAASDDLSSTTTSMRGTVCYVAPEFGGVGVLSEASDIYSFGVLLLVIISGRRPLEIITSTNKAKGMMPSVSSSPTVRFERANLITWARNLAYSGNVLDLIDDRLHGIYPREQAQLCISVALLCIQRLPSARPTVGTVVKTLLGESTLPTFPIECSPSPPSRLSVQQSPLGATLCLSSSEEIV